MSKFHSWRMVSGIISIVIGFGVILLVPLAHIVSAFAQAGTVSPASMIAFGALLVAAGIISILTKDRIGLIPVVLGWICVIAASSGLVFAGIKLNTVAIIWSIVLAVVSVYAACAE